MGGNGAMNQDESCAGRWWRVCRERVGI